MSHEANTFCPRAATRADFEANQLARGEALLDNWRAKRTEESGAMTVFAQTDGCEVVPTFGARALSSAPLTAEAFDSLLADLLAALREALPVDGVCWCYTAHKAITPRCTGEILRAGELVGRLSYRGTLDLHAHVTVRMARMAPRSWWATTRAPLGLFVTASAPRACWCARSGRDSATSSLSAAHDPAA
jgi:microcystin degradation protein MlrC